MESYNIKCIQFQPSLNGKSPKGVLKWRDGKNEQVRNRAVKIEENPTRYCRHLHGDFRIEKEIEYMPTSGVNDLNLCGWAGATFIYDYNLEDMTMTITKPYLFSIGRMGKISIEGLNLKDLMMGLGYSRSMDDIMAFVQKTSFLHKFLSAKQKEDLWLELKDSISEVTEHISKLFGLKHNPRDIFDALSSFIIDIFNDLDELETDYTTLKEKAISASSYILSNNDNPILSKCIEIWKDEPDDEVAASQLLAEKWSDYAEIIAYFRTLESNEKANANQKEWQKILKYWNDGWFQKFEEKYVIIEASQDDKESLNNLVDVSFHQCDEITGDGNIKQVVIGFASKGSPFNPIVKAKLEFWQYLFINLDVLHQCIKLYGGKINVGLVESLVNTLDKEINSLNKELIMNQLTEQEKTELNELDAEKVRNLISERKWQIISKNALTKKLFDDNAVAIFNDILIPKENQESEDLPSIESFVNEALAAMSKIGIKRVDDIKAGSVFTDDMALKGYKKSNKAKHTTSKADHNKIYEITNPGIEIDGIIKQMPVCSVYMFED